MEVFILTNLQPLKENEELSFKMECLKALMQEACIHNTEQSIKQNNLIL